MTWPLLYISMCVLVTNSRTHSTMSVASPLSACSASLAISLSSLSRKRGTVWRQYAEMLSHHILYTYSQEVKLVVNILWYIYVLNANNFWLFTCTVVHKDLGQFAQFYTYMVSWLFKLPACILRTWSLLQNYIQSSTAEKYINYRFAHVVI